MEETPFKIAVFRALFLGDMLCIIPTIRAVRMAYPHAKIYLIGLPWERDFVKRFTTYFDEFIEFPGWPGLPEQDVDIVNSVGFLVYMQQERFDLVLQMQGNGMLTNTMCSLWGGKQLTGLRKENEFCPDENLFPVSDDSEHEVLRFLKLLQGLHIPPQSIDLEFPIMEDERNEYNVIAQQLGLSPGQYICIHPGSRDPKRRWPASSFAAIARVLAAENYQVLLTGSTVERELLIEVERLAAVPLLSMATITQDISLGNLATVIEKSQLLLANDTGVSHLAAAFHIPSVILFSPYSCLTRWSPLNSELHTVIPPAQSADVQYVHQIVESKLRKLSAA